MNDDRPMMIVPHTHGGVFNHSHKDANGMEYTHVHDVYSPKGEQSMAISGSHGNPNMDIPVINFPGSNIFLPIMDPEASE